jgi:hypothetical protein
LTPSQGKELTEALGQQLFADLGQWTPEGYVAEGTLSSAPLSSSRISVRFHDYFADITAMNLPTTGVAVREQYLSAMD